VLDEGVAFLSGGMAKLPDGDHQRYRLEDERHTQDHVADEERLVALTPVEQHRDALVEREESAHEEDEGRHKKRPEEAILSVPVGMLLVRCTLREVQAD
jgi:hypothetical protein